MEESTVEFYAELIANTGTQLFVSDGENNFYLPINNTIYKKIDRSNYSFIVPIWLAKKKGII